MSTGPSDVVAHEVDLLGESHKGAVVVSCAALQLVARDDELVVLTYHVLQAGVLDHHRYGIVGIVGTGEELLGEFENLKLRLSLDEVLFYERFLFGLVFHFGADLDNALVLLIVLDGNLGLV